MWIKDCYCDQVVNHHRSLCPKKIGAANREGTYLVEEQSLEEDSSVSEKALLSSGDMFLCRQPRQTFQIYR